MIIGFDGKRAVNNNTGLGNYSRLVLEELSARLSDSADELRVYAPRMRENPRLAQLLDAPNVRFAVNDTKMPSAIWRSLGLPKILRRDGVALYHGLSNELPLNVASAGVPSVVTVHDIIYRRLPYCYAPADRFLYDRKYGRSCRCADRIIAISECTKRDIMHYYKVSEEKIDVVYQGCHPQFYRTLPPSELEEIRRRLTLPNRYIVQVGTIERRKNLILTIEALPGLPEDVKLVAVGRGTDYLRQAEQTAERLGVRDRLIIMSDIGFADLPGVYQCAEAIAYPSRYEGFGLPVIEGLASCRPVVAATGSCLEEAGGDAAMYVDSDDVRGMTEALRAAICGEADTAAMAARGRKYIRRFDTSKMADNILAVYRKLLSK